MSVATMTLPDYQLMARKISAWTRPTSQKYPKLISFLIALAFHIILFVIGGFIFVQAPEYGIDVSQSGVDIYLVAAPSDANLPMVKPDIQPVLAKEKSEIDIPVAQLKEAVKPVEKKKLMVTAKESEHRGDGSSALPGESATTFSSAGSGQTDEKPGYLKNPPPSYPSEAVAKEQEGLVLLSVSIDRRGRPQKVELKKSSGFPLLDESALKTVKKWKFSPGRTGALIMESEATIPVRFRLEDVKKK